MYFHTYLAQLSFYYQGMPEFINILGNWSWSAPVANTIWPIPLHQNFFCYFICSSLVHNTKVLVNCEHFSLILTNTYKPRIFPKTSLKPVNISKNSSLNWAMKLNFPTCFFFLFPFYSSILLTLWFRYLQAQLDTYKESCMYFCGQLFFKAPHGTLKLQIFSFVVYYGATLCCPIVDKEKNWN